MAYAQFWATKWSKPNKLAPTWSERHDLNVRPLGPEPSALPTEPCDHAIRGRKYNGYGAA